MADLVDVATNDIITASRQNDINDYIEDGTHKINTLSVDVGGVEVVTSSRALTNITFDANGTGNSVSNIDLTADVTGVLPVANGGTGLATITSNSYVKGNGTGVLIERTYAEVKTDLSLDSVENTALSTWTGSSSITTIGTISTGTWNATTIAIANGGTGQTTQQAALDAIANSSSGTNGQVLTTDGTNASWQDASGGGGASQVYERKIEGDVYTTTLMPIVVPDALAGLDIGEVRIALASLPTGSAFKVDVRKNGTATTDSIFTSDTEIEIGTGQSATNGLYITGCDSSGATVGTPGTTIDSAQDTLSADDVLWVVITQVGSTLAGTDFVFTMSVS